MVAVKTTLCPFGQFVGPLCCSRVAIRSMRLCRIPGACMVAGELSSAGSRLRRLAPTCSWRGGMYLKLHRRDQPQAKAHSIISRFRHLSPSTN